MKKILVPLMLFALLLCLSGCSSKDISLDVNELAEDVLKNAEFTDDLASVDAEVAVSLYGIEGAVNQVVYMGSGATAEEIAVFEFESEDEAGKAIENAKKRIDDQEKAFEDYAPAEIPKLQSAVIKTGGKYLAVCVGGGKQAEEIINKYFE